jgi:hypothetical protein
MMLASGAAPLAVIDGVHSGLGISKTTGMGFQIEPGRAAINGATAADGTFTTTLTAPELGVFEAGDATKDRIDLVVLQTYPNNPSSTGTQVEVVKGSIATGTEPIVPATPTGALVLFQVRIPAGMSAGNGGWDLTKITDRRRKIGIPYFQTYTPTWSGFASLGTGAVREGRYRVDGDKVTLHLHLKGGAGASMGGGNLSFNLPITPSVGYRYYGSGSLHHPDNNGVKYDLRVYTNGPTGYLWDTRASDGQLVPPGTLAYPYAGGTEIYATLEYVIDLQ